MNPAIATFGWIVTNPRLKLLDQVRELCRLRYYSRHTEQAHVGGAKRYLVFVKAQCGGWRHYILVALMRHPKGDEYLVELARAVDDLITDRP